MFCYWSGKNSVNKYSFNFYRYWIADYLVRHCGIWQISLEWTHSSDNHFFPNLNLLPVSFSRWTLGCQHYKVTAKWVLIQQFQMVQVRFNIIYTFEPVSCTKIEIKFISWNLSTFLYMIHLFFFCTKDMFCLNNMECFISECSYSD